uniref:Uncharacterized protein n=1 Tax=Cyprinus carpio TaxID=7962 RepID=A0A8C1YPH2_CYPCA
MTITCQSLSMAEQVSDRGYSPVKPCLSACVIVLYRLSYCGITDEGCAALASALRSNPSHLRELNLSENKIGDLVSCLCPLMQILRLKLVR